MGFSIASLSSSTRLSKTAIFAFIILIGFSNSLLSQDDSAWWKSLFRPKNTQCDSSGASTLIPTKPMQSADTEKMESSDPVEKMWADVEEPKDTGNGVNINRKEGHFSLTWDPRMAQLDSAWKEQEHPLMGYRVQLYSGSLQQAREFRSLARKRTTLPLYLSSMPPNYRITLGDFRSKWEAQKEKQVWLKTFPLALVIPMEIELPALGIAQ
jgi:hypothetical protein